MFVCFCYFILFNQCPQKWVYKINNGLNFYWHCLYKTMVFILFYIGWPDYSLWSKYQFYLLQFTDDNWVWEMLRIWSMIQHWWDRWDTTSGSILLPCLAIALRGEQKVGLGLEDNQITMQCLCSYNRKALWEIECFRMAIYID